MLIREKMETYDFSNSEKAVISFILEKGKDIEKMTMKNIGDAAYVAPSTLIRIAHKLGYNGWDELKIDYLDEVKYLESHFQEIDANYPFTKEDNLTSVANKIGQLKIETINDTLSMITYDDLRKAVQILLNANSIHIFATSTNAIICHEFQDFMMRIQKDVIVHNIQGEILYGAASLKKGACAILISYTGYSSIIVNCSKYLKQNQIPIIAITNIGENPIAKIADVVLKMTTREKQYSKIGNFSTDTSVIFLLEILYACVFSKNYDQNKIIRDNLAQSIEINRNPHLEIIKEQK